MLSNYSAVSVVVFTGKTLNNAGLHLTADALSSFGSPWKLFLQVKNVKVSEFFSV